MCGGSLLVWVQKADTESQIQIPTLSVVSIFMLMPPHLLPAKGKIDE